MDKLEISHDHSTPHRPQTNGVAERAVRRVKEGTSAALVQSGLADMWWKEAMECYCMLRNVVDVLHTGHTAYHNRFGVDFPGPLLPFGQEVEYKPTSKQDIARTHQLGNKLLPGLFAGYVQQEGGGWSGDLWVIDQDEFQQADLHSEVYLRQIPAPEVFPRLQDGKWKFPVATGDWQQPEG